MAMEGVDTHLGDVEVAFLQKFTLSIYLSVSSYANPISISALSTSIYVDISAALHWASCDFGIYAYLGKGNRLLNIIVGEASKNEVEALQDHLLNAGLGVSCARHREDRLYSLRLEQQ